MGLIDYIVIVLYFVVVIGLGFWYKKRASRNLESYFLGAKNEIATLHLEACDDS